MAFIFFSVTVIKCLYFFLSVSYSKNGKNRNWLNYYGLYKYCEPWSKTVLLEPQRKTHNPIPLTHRGKCSKYHVKQVVFFILWEKYPSIFFALHFLYSAPQSFQLLFFFLFNIYILYKDYLWYIQCVCLVAKSCLTLAALWTVMCQVLLSMRFSW